jgi:Holliday junction resolvase
MNGKRKGSRNERRTMRLLESSGYACTRAAASLGVFDVVGVGSTDILLVQVKSSEWPRAEEMESLKLFRCPPNARKLIHRWRDRVRMPDVREIP